MKKGNIIKLLVHQDQCHNNSNPNDTPRNDTSISDELKIAIQHLIHQLREGPQSSSSSSC